MADFSLSQLTKICTRCLRAKPATLECFSPHRMGKYGIHSLCRPCKKINDAERRARPDQKARQKAWRDANKDYVKRYNDAYRVEHKSTEYVARWRANNIERAREQEAARNRNRRQTDPAYLLKCRLSSRLKMMLQGKAGKTTEQILGYSSDQLRAHIERQFTKGMSWDRVMAREIEIDHILPVASFRIVSLDDPDMKVCWALANLRPMWTKENRSKGKKRLTLL